MARSEIQTWVSKLTCTTLRRFNVISILDRFYCLSQGRSFRCWRRSSHMTWRTCCCPSSMRWSTPARRRASCLLAVTLRAPTTLDNSVQAKDRTRDLPRPCLIRFIHIRWDLVEMSTRITAPTNRKHTVLGDDFVSSPHSSVTCY
jgi:hypothetical protein